MSDVRATPILDEINRKIDQDKQEHYAKGNWSEDFEPADIVLTPERFIALMQEVHDRYHYMTWVDRKWRGALIRVVRSA
jgi:hypothetical protein